MQLKDNILDSLLIQQNDKKDKMNKIVDLKNQEDFEAVFISLKKIYKNLKHNINEYNIIFVENKDINDMVVKTSSTFFDDLYRLYWANITMQICALLDKKETLGNDNLTIPQLLDMIANLHFECTSTAEKIFGEINSKIKPFKTARNKYFGHFDLKLAISNHIFDKLSIADLSQICDHIEEIFNLIEEYLGRPKISYSKKSETGAIKILPIIKLGIEKEMEERLR